MDLGGLVSPGSPTRQKEHILVNCFKYACLTKNAVKINTNFIDYTKTFLWFIYFNTRILCLLGRRRSSCRKINWGRRRQGERKAKDSPEGSTCPGLLPSGRTPLPILSFPNRPQASPKTLRSPHRQAWAATVHRWRGQAQAIAWPRSVYMRSTEGEKDGHGAIKWGY